MRNNLAATHRPVNSGRRDTDTEKRDISIGPPHFRCAHDGLYGQRWTRLKSQKLRLLANGVYQPGGVEHHNIPATAAPTDPLAQQGKLNFESKCLACHSIAGGDKLGPNLYLVTRRREEAWLTRWLKDPEGMLQTDPIAKEMLAKYKIPMPNQNASDEELKSYVAYFKWADQNLRPRGIAQPQPAAPDAARGPDQTPSAPGAAGSPQPPLPPSPH